MHTPGFLVSRTRANQYAVRMKRKLGDPARVWPEYWATEYRFQRDDEWLVLRFGAAAWATASSVLDLPATWGIVTAWNPMSIRLRDDENHLRQVRLARAVADLGLRADAAANRAPDGTWAEEGWCCGASAGANCSGWPIGSGNGRLSGAFRAASGCWKRTRNAGFRGLAALCCAEPSRRGPILVCC